MALPRVELPHQYAMFTINDKLLGQRIGINREFVSERPIVMISALLDVLLWPMRLAGVPDWLSVVGVVLTALYMFVCNIFALFSAVVRHCSSIVQIRHDHLQFLQVTPNFHRAPAALRRHRVPTASRRRHDRLGREVPQRGTRHARIVRAADAPNLPCSSLHAAQFGRIWGSFVGRKPLYVIADANMVRDICIREFSNFTNRNAVRAL